MTKFTYSTIKICGSKLYLDLVDKPIFYGHENKGNKIRRNESIELLNPEACFIKSRKKIRELIETNAYAYKNKHGTRIPPMFMTITFQKNEQDFILANLEFHKFIKRLNYLNKQHSGGNIMYVAVHEFQKRGAIHFHIVIFNMEFIPNIFQELLNIWGKNGSIDNKVVDSLPILMSYVFKYMQKKFSVTHIKNQKRFYSSKGLCKPNVIRDSGEVEDIIKAVPREIPYQTCEPFPDQEGRIHNRTIFNFPPNFDMQDFLLHLPQDTERLAKKIFGVE
jgi:hypothetical protein